MPHTVSLPHTVSALEFPVWSRSSYTVHIDSYAMYSSVNTDGPVSSMLHWPVLYEFPVARSGRPQACIYRFADMVGPPSVHMGQDVLQHIDHDRTTLSSDEARTYQAKLFRDGFLQARSKLTGSQTKWSLASTATLKNDSTMSAFFSIGLPGAKGG